MPFIVERKVCISLKEPKSSQPATTPADAFLERGTPVFRRVSLAFLMAGLVTFANLYSVQPLFPAFTHRFHLSPAEASLSLSVTTLLLSISLPIAALVSDALGRKRVMVASLVASSAFGVLAAFSPSYSVLLIFRALEGLVLAGLPAVAMTYLSEEMSPASLGYAMGLYISGNSIGGLLGRITVSWLSDVANWRVALAVLGLASVVLSLLFWTNLPSSRHFAPKRIAVRSVLASFGNPFKDPGLVALFLTGAALMGGFVSLYNYIGFRLLAPPYRLSQSVVGLLFVVYLVGTVSSSWMGRLADKIGRRSVLLINVIVMGLGAAITLVDPLWLIIGGIAVFTFGFFGGHSIASSWIGRRAQENKAQASALYLLFYYVGSSLGGSFAGVFWSRDGWSGTIDMILCFVGGALILALALCAIRPVASTPSHRSTTQKSE